jgi:outer membrane lipoprotein LolB
MPNIVFRALALVLMLLTAACSVPLTQPDVGSRSGLLDWDQRQSFLKGINAWGVDGRIAMRTANDAWSASLKWRQHKADYDLELYGPLGRKLMSVTGSDDYVILTTDEGETFSESSASSLIYRQTGWQVPVEYLRYWARAMVVPGIPANSRFDDLGRLSHLNQSEWDITYQDYRILGQLEMPRKIRLSHREFSVKLIMRDWQLEQASDGSAIHHGS